ncbi:hypothetical protein GJV04_14650 [Enterobacteriaceae bacterium RIT714]|nr:hypothetical protein [Enterobacteriaceae bacterium RIT714]
MSNCDPECPCRNPDAPKYPAGKIFKNQHGALLMVVDKNGKFPDARYTLLEVGTGKRRQYSYPALVRKEMGK